MLEDEGLEQAESEAVDDDMEVVDDVDEEIEELDDQQLLASLEECGLDEEDARDIFLELLTQPSSKGGRGGKSGGKGGDRKRTWKDARQLRTSLRLSRGQPSQSGSSAGARPRTAFQAARRASAGAGGSTRGKLSIEDIKKVSRCGNCGQMGHWHKECKNPTMSKDDREKQQGNKGNYMASSQGQHETAFGFASEEDDADDVEAH